MSSPTPEKTPTTAELLQKQIELLEKILAALTAKPAAAAPRTAANGPLSGWRGTIIGFGKKQGTALGGMKPNDLEWWVTNYQPKPFKGKLDPESVALRAALDAAALELGITNAPPPVQAPAAPAPEQDDGGDVPF